MYASLNEEIEARLIVVRALERMEKDDPQGVRYIRRHLLAMDEQLAATLKAAQGGVTEAINALEEIVRDEYGGTSMIGEKLAHIATVRAALSAQQGEAVAWRFKLDDGSFQYGTAGHEVRIPRPIVEATPLYTAPPAQQGQGAAWDARGGSLWLDREQWGVVIDALIEHRASAAKRKNGNPDSTSDVRADECGDLIGKITSAAKSITAPPAQPAERVPEDTGRIDWMEANARSVSFGKAPTQGYWVHVQGIGYSGGSNRSLREAIDAARKAQAASPAPSPARGDGDAAARQLYIDSQGDAHNLHTLAWSELSEAQRNKWREKATQDTRP